MDPIARPGSIAARLAATTRVLSIEDEADIAEFLRAYFRASGYDFVHIDPGSALEVVRAIESVRPDAVLLDIGLRGFSGLDVYDLVRAERRFDHVPIIVVSADETVRYVERLRHSADDVVSKPFNANTLGGLVASRIAAAQAATAPLTSAALAEALEDEIASAASRAEPLSFALFHVRGRDGASLVRRRIRELLPAGAVVGTGDGDELAVVLPARAAEDAHELVAAIVLDIGDTVDLPGGASVAVTVTAGVASFPDHAATADELFMAADAALAGADPVGLAI